MALHINGTGEDSLDLNGINLDTLTVDGVLVWEKYSFLMTATSTLEPVFLAEGGTLQTRDNGDGTWDILGSDITRVYPSVDDITANRSVTAIVVKSTKGLTSMESMFEASPTLGGNVLENVESIVFENTVDTSTVTSMKGTFKSLTSLTSLDILNLNTTFVQTFELCFSTLTTITNIQMNNDIITSACTNIRGIFSSCLLLTSLDVSGWDTSLVTDAANVFSSCNAITSLDLSNWDVSNVTTLQSTFYGMHSLTDLDVSTWTTTLLENMSFSFYYCNSIEHINFLSWDFSNITTMAHCFRETPSLKCLTNLDTTAWASTVDKQYIFWDTSSLEAPDTATVALLESSAGLNWTNSSPCPISNTPPIYLLTEALTHPDTYWYVHNSANSGVQYDGRLEHSSLSVEGNDGDPWEPTNSQYPGDGTIDLNVNGNATRQINTQWIPPSDEEWTISGIYNVIMNISYDMYSLHYHGDGTMDVYLGSSTEDLVLTYEGIPYTPTGTEWIILATPPPEVAPYNLKYTMNNFITI